MFFIITGHLSLYTTHLRNFRYLFLGTISQSPRIYYVLKFCILLSFISSLSLKFPTRPHILLNENSNHLSTYYLPLTNCCFRSFPSFLVWTWVQRRCSVKRRCTVKRSKVDAYQIDVYHVFGGVPKGINILLKLL